MCRGFAPGDFANSEVEELEHATTSVFHGYTSGHVDGCGLDKFNDLLRKRLDLASSAH